MDRNEREEKEKYIFRLLGELKPEQRKNVMDFIDYLLWKLEGRQKWHVEDLPGKEVFFIETVRAFG